VYFSYFNFFLIAIALLPKQTYKEAAYKSMFFLIGTNIKVDCLSNSTASASLKLQSGLG
jgi:hypothetical protein